jgi:hypothetical protein
MENFPNLALVGITMHRLALATLIVPPATMSTQLAGNVIRLISLIARVGDHR